MYRLSKLTTLTLVVLIAALTACAPAATPVPPAATNPPPPTSTPAPTSTIPPKPTPEPIKGKFDAGGVNLNLLCLGEGSPTVVLDAGWGMDWRTWNVVMPKIQSHTRVCAYDRASMRYSDDQPGLRTSGQIAEQLHTLLANAKVESPYLVVGHSLGGMNMLVFADRYRDEVAGVVLVDSAHPDQSDQWLAVLPTPAPDEATAITDIRKGIAWSNPEAQSFPEPMNWDELLAQVRAVKSLGSLPLAVLVRADPKKSGWGDIPPELAAGLDKVWLDLQKEYTNLSTDSSLILAKKSGHFIQDDEPKLVIDAILGLVEKARKK